MLEILHVICNYTPNKTRYNVLLTIVITDTDGNQSVWDEFFLELEPIAANQPCTCAMSTLLPKYEALMF